MDYKYIEQLTERYFQCETTLQEEQILKAFFAQDEQELPQELSQYKPLFAAMQPEEQLGDDFDARLLALTEEPRVVKARTISLAERLQPLMRAAAVVAVVLTLANAIDHAVSNGQPLTDEINYAAYKDTYDDPSMAYDQVEDALMLISEGFSQAQGIDSVSTDSLIGQLR